MDYAPYIGSLIYLSQKRTDIIFAVNKLAKFMRKPGKWHFDALVHLLRYLQDNNNFGIRFFLDFTTSPLYHHLGEHELPMDQLLMMMCDSSRHDDVDTGWSTGCFMIMGGNSWPQFKYAWSHRDEFSWSGIQSNVCGDDDITSYLHDMTT